MVQTQGHLWNTIAIMSPSILPPIVASMQIIIISMYIAILLKLNHKFIDFDLVANLHM